MSNDSAWYSKNEKYGEIKDSTFQKTMFEFGAGTESIFTGIENCFGVNDDLDGIPMQTVTSKVDGLIMSDAGTVESKIYGISKIGGALLPIAAVSVIPGAGGMAASGEIAVSIGTASAYGLSAGGNAYASAKQEGYTDYQSKMYGTMAGVKETAKMMAFAGVSKIIPANGTGSLLKESLSIGATDAVIEFADETLVTPNMSAVILDNPELKEVDYKEALLNSLTTGGIFAGMHFAGGTVKNIGNKLQEKQTAGNKNCSEGLTDGTIADNVTKVEATENITTETGNAKPIETSYGESSSILTKPNTTRINLANGRTRFTPLRESGNPVSAGMHHVIDGHFNRSLSNSRSIFTISVEDLKGILQRKSVIASQIIDLGNGQYKRVVDVGEIIGNTALKYGGKPTSWIEIITYVKGNIITTYPVPKP